MWQRVQTLYLALAVAFTAVLFFSVKAYIIGSGGVHSAEFKYISYLPYAILIAAVAFLNLLALFSFRVRVFQMRTAMLAALVSLALQIWLAVDFFSTRGQMIFKISAVFPLLVVILDLLAAKAVFADEVLVESASRIRDSKRRRRR